MTQLAYDDVWVREPALLTPKRKPVGLCKIEVGFRRFDFRHFWLFQGGVSDLIRGRQAALTNCSFAGRAEGLCLDNSASGALVEFDSELGKLDLGSATILLVAESPSSWGDYAGVATRAPAWNESTAPWFLESRASAGNFWFGSMGTLWDTGIGCSQFASKLLVVVISLSAGNAEILINHVYAARGTGFSTPTYSTEKMRLGTFFTSAKNSLIFHAFALANKPVPAAIARKIVVNPYVMLEPA